VIGDPRHATAELGERLWNATVQEATSALLVVNQPPVEPNETKSNQGTMTLDCLFCRIIAGSEPGNIVYSDGDVVVFIPPKPESRVHLILAPRTHITSADALQVEDAGLWMHLLQIARLLAREHGIDEEEEGYHLGTNAGRDTTREFAHLHMWLMNGSQA
jgi:histidine triad (HIT) family protein